MLVKQISVFLENKSGRLAEVINVLSENGINIRALSIADTTDFGILRLIVNKPEEAEKCLGEQGFTVSFTNVIAISVADKPGGLSAALNVLDAESIEIEYMYAFVGKKSQEALVILRIDEPEKATEILQENGVRIISSSEAYEL